jgi:ankyrin repeat protein
MKIFIILFSASLAISNLFAVSSVGRIPSVDPLVRACETKNLQKVDELLKEGTNPNIVDKSSSLTPLMAASLEGSIEIVRSLLKAGADVDQVNWNSENALMSAVASGSEDIALLLILWGADIKHKSNGLTTAFLIAAQNSSMRVLTVLKEKGANINERGWNNRTALHLAALASTPVTIPGLLDWGLDINAQDDEGLTPLMYAVKFNATQPGIITTGKLPPLETVQILLEKGADCFITNKDGKTALGIAKDGNASALIELIETHCKSQN